MITFEAFKQLMKLDTNCIEILFSVAYSKKFDCCWMGKSSDRKNGEDIYWYGLTTDGKNAYDYPNFDDFCTAKVFDGKSLFELWDNLDIKEINGCDPMEMIGLYLNGGSDPA